MALQPQTFYATTYVGVTPTTILLATELRHTGLSLGHNVASVLAGGLSPLIAVSLLAWSDGAFWTVACFMAALGVVTVTMATETRLTDLNAEVLR